MELNQHQKKTLELIQDFVSKKDESIFILKGYAGTGKTTLIKSIIPAIQEKGISVSLMAPTGRAAKILSDKTGYIACTIHRCIYSYNNMQAV